jgi:hypothetical protein
MKRAMPPPNSLSRWRERAGVRMAAARETLTPTLSHPWERASSAVEN